MYADYYNEYKIVTALPIMGEKKASRKVSKAQELSLLGPTSVLALPVHSAL